MMLLLATNDYIKMNKVKIKGSQRTSRMKKKRNKHLKEIEKKVWNTIWIQWMKAREE